MAINEIKEMWSSEGICGFDNCIPWWLVMQSWYQRKENRFFFSVSLYKNKLIIQV